MSKALVLGLVFLGVAPGAAGAESNKEQARVLFRQGNAALEKKAYEEALEKFRAARKLFPSYKIDFNIATTLDDMGRLPSAADHYELFLRRAVTTAPPRYIQAARQRFDALKKKVASVKLDCASGARVTVDGKAVGETPLQGRIYLMPGKHELEVKKDGHVTATRSLELAVDDHREVAITLEAAAVAPEPPSEATDGPASAPVVEEQPAPKKPARVATSAPSRPAARAERPEVTIQRDASASRKRRTKTIVGYSSLGAGAACVAAAGVLYIIGALQGNEAHDAYQAAVVPAEIEGHWQDVRSASTKLLVGHVLAGVGVAAVGFGLYQLLTRPSASGGSAGRGPALNLAVTRDTTSVVVSGRF